MKQDPKIKQAEQTLEASKQEVAKTRKKLIKTILTTLRNCLIRSVIFSLIMVFLTTALLTNPLVITPLLLGNYSSAFMQFLAYISLFLGFDLLFMFNTLKRSFYLLFTSKGI